MTSGAGYGYVEISNYTKFVFFDYLVRTGKKIPSTSIVILEALESGKHF